MRRNPYTWTPSLKDVFLKEIMPDMQKIKSRIKYKDHRWVYEPSQEYTKFVEQMTLKYNKHGK